MKYICEYCNKEFDKKQSLSAHKGHCKLSPLYNEEAYKNRMLTTGKKAGNTLHKKFEDSKQEYTFNCIKCGKEYTLKLSETEYLNGYYRKHCTLKCANTHIITDEIKNKISKSVIAHLNNINISDVEKEQRKQQRFDYLIKHFDTFKNAKFGNAKLLDTRIEYINDYPKVVHEFECRHCGKHFTNIEKRDIKNYSFCSSNCSKCWQKLHNGGLRVNSGYGKCGWYKGIFCNSTWELAFVIYHIDHNLPIKRCTEKRKYIYNGKEYSYFPDFVTNEGIIEIKGYITNQWLAKLQYNKDIKVIYYKDIKKYLEYVKETYNKEYNNMIDLYD